MGVGLGGGLVCSEPDCCTVPVAGRLKLPGFLSNWLSGLELEEDESFGLASHQLKFALKEEADGRLEHCRVGL